MCGIVGLVAKSKNGFFKRQTDVFFQLLRVDELRGEDSTGLVYVENDTGFGILKEASAASWCADHLERHAFLKDNIRMGKALLGHNRKATVGRITDETAHPFVVDDTFAMVHNGTLRGHKSMKDTEVDSEALAHHLAPLLSADTLDLPKFEEEMGKVDGAFAIAAYSQPNNKVFLMRNSERPLCFCETDDGFYWASEFGALFWILGRNNVDLSKHKIVVVPSHTLLDIDLDTNTLTETKFVPKKATPRTVPMSTGVSGKTISRGFNSNKKNGEGVLSKNEFKRLRRQWIYTRIAFYADDYVEADFPNTFEKGSRDLLLMGEPDGAQFTGYDIRTASEVNVTALLGPVDDINQVMDQVYHGVIRDMEYNKITGEITLYLDKVAVFSKSVVDNLVQGKWNAQTPSVH